MGGAVPLLQRLSIGVVGGGITQEQVAVSDALFHGDTHAKAVSVWVKHGLEVSGGANPIFHRLLRDI